MAAKEPDCVLPGYEEYEKCARCGLDTGYTAIPALGHDIVHVEEKLPTCTETGWEAYDHCKRCEYTTLDERIKPLGHDLVDHECTRCEKDLYGGRLYGYEYLGTMQNGANRQAFYDELAAAAKAFDKDTLTDMDTEEDQPFAHIVFTQYGLSLEDAVVIWKTFKDDNPVYYWMSNVLYYGDDYVEPAVNVDYALGEKRSKYNALIDESVMQLAAEIIPDASVYDTVLGYHDAIILDINYVYDEYGYPQSESWAHNIIGVLEKRGAVCEGYSRTFQLLLNYADVESIFVTGWSGTVKHAWNLVRMDDGDWYWFDLTFDENGNYGSGVTYDYFCATDTEFLADHVCDTPQGETVEFLYKLPERSDHDYVSDGIMLGKTIETGNMVYRVAGYNAVAFIGCNGGEEIVVPEKIEYQGRTFEVIIIGSEDELSVFENNSEVRTISIPSSVRMIWDDALMSDSLENITVSEDNATYTSVDGVLYTKNLYTLIKFPSASAIQKLIISENTYMIANKAFDNCKNLSAIHFGVNIDTVGVLNWGSGYPVKDGIVNVYSGEIIRIYQAMTGEKELTIAPENDSYCMDDIGLYNITKTTLLYIHNKSITTYKVAANLTSIEDIGGYNMFDDCSLLQSISVEEGNQHFISYNGVLYDKDFTDIIAVPKCIYGHIYVCSGVTNIEPATFKDRKNITGVTLPQSVTNIEMNAFSGCTSLSSLVLSSKLNKIGTRAFENCTSLTSVTIPSSVNFIANFAFSGCSGLTDVTFENCNGWTVSSWGNTKNINSYDLSDTENAKEYLVNVYLRYHWTRNA